MKPITHDIVLSRKEREILVGLGVVMGRHEAFGSLAGGCTAAQAESLKRLRDSGEYKQLARSWQEFCERWLKISRVHANRLIQTYEEHGPGYFRLARLVPMSEGTYRLIADKVSDDAIEVDGEKVPIAPEHREKIAAAVKAEREKAAPKPKLPSVPVLRKQLDGFIAAALALANGPDERLELLRLVQEGSQRMANLSEALHKTTFVIE